MAAKRMADRSSSSGIWGDVYTALLGISLAAMVTGCVFLYLDYAQYSAKKPESLPPPPAIKAPGTGAPAQPGR